MTQNLQCEKVSELHVGPSELFQCYDDGGRAMIFVAEYLTPFVAFQSKANISGKFSEMCSLGLVFTAVKSCTF